MDKLKDAAIAFVFFQLIVCLVVLVIMCLGSFAFWFIPDIYAILTIIRVVSAFGVFMWFCFLFDRNGINILDRK